MSTAVKPSGSALEDACAATVELWKQVMGLSEADMATWLRSWLFTPPSVTPQPPSTPGGLAASSANPVVLTLGTPSHDPLAVTGYEVWRSTTSGAEVKIATTSGFAYTDSTVAPLTTYFYKTRAFNGAGLFSAFSNEATCSVPGGLAPDTTAPLTPGGAPTLLSKSVTTVALALPLVADSTVNSGTQVVSGMKGYQVYVGGVAQGALVAQPTSPLAFTVGFDIGAPAIAGSDAVAAGIYTIHAGGANFGGTSDQCHVVPALLIGDFDVQMPISSISGGTAYARGGLMVRDGFDAGAQFFCVETFQDQTIGFDSLWRPGPGQACQATGHFVHALPYSCRLKRSGSTFTAYISPDGVSQTQINQQSLPQFSQALRLCLYLSASDYTGPPFTLSATMVCGPVALTALTAVEFDDSFAGSPTPVARPYTYAGVDNVNNVGAQSPVLSVTPNAAGGGGSMKYDPGQGMASFVNTTLGNKDNSFNDAGPQKANEISVLHASPAYAGTYVSFYYWRSLNNVKGQIDASAAGSGLDADYKNWTGYQSGTVGVGGGPVYSDPRRGVIWILTGDFFSVNGAARNIPDWVLNDATYGPAVNGQNGIFLGPGSGGAATGNFGAFYRPAMVTAFEQFLQLLAGHTFPDGYTVDTSPYIEAVCVLSEISDEPQNSDSSYNGEADFYAKFAQISDAAVTYFPHTSVGINANYSSDAANAQTLVAHMAANRAMLMPGDTFGLTSGSNICLGLCGETFGQLIFRGMKPNGDPYNNPWIAGGTVYKGVMACLGLAAQTETIYNSPNNYTTQDIFNQANLVGYTHFMIGFAQNASPQSANWIGSAPNMATWNSAPGTFGGGLDTEKNNTLSNSTRPSNMP